MTHLLHLFRSDVWRLRLVLAVWIVIVAANAVVMIVTPLVVAQPPVAEPIGVLSSLLWLAMLVFTFALVSLAVHGDPVVGTTAFWMTRPVPPISLLLAKLTLIAGALLVAPALAESALLALNRMRWTTSAGVVADDVIFRMVVLLILMLAAVWTRNLARFALLCGSGLLAIVAALALFVAVQVSQMQDTPVVAEESRETADGYLIFSALLVVAAIVALAVQYVTRSRRWSVPIAIGGVILASTISSVWPTRFLETRLIVPAWAEQPAALLVTADPATISTNSTRDLYPQTRQQWSTINAALRIAPPEREWIADVALREATVTLPDGTILRSPGTWRTTALFVVGGSVRLEHYSVLRDVLGVNVLGNVAPVPPDDRERPENLPVLFLMRQPELAPHVGERGHYRGRFKVSLTHFGVEAVLPIQPGALHHDGAYRLVLDDVISMNGEPAIVAREARASSMWDRRPWSQYSFYLRNQARNEAIEVSDFTLHRAFSLLRFLPLGDFSVGASPGAGRGFYSRGMVLIYPPRYNPRGETIEIDRDWLAGAELVIIRQTQEGSVERVIEIDDFPL